MNLAAEVPFDVEIERLHYLFQIAGPTELQVLEKAAGEACATSRSCVSATPGSRLQEGRWPIRGLG